MSVKWSYLGWYIGIKKSGKPKRGSKTWYPPHQKAIQFVAKKQSPSQSFPDTFDFGNDNDTRVRRDVGLETEHKVESHVLNTNALRNNDNAKFSPEESNHSPILYIDDESAGVADVTKTTSVSRVLQDLSL